jgi:predicted GIY-YIG superfamily endonuclease
MHYVYVLQSESHPSQQYIGLTHHLRRRLRQHNNAIFTAHEEVLPLDPRRLFCFSKEAKAIAFEKYLKSGSGRAFLNRHVVCA